MNVDLVDTKVLLLGYTGYIGTTLAKVLSEKKVQVICPIRNKNNIEKKKNIVFVDISQIESVLETLSVKPTTIISLSLIHISEPTRPY